MIDMIIMTIFSLMFTTALTGLFVGLFVLTEEL